MSSLGNTTENDIVKLLMNSVALSGSWGNDLYVSLHTADPGEGGDQTTSETTYGSYARVAVTRNGSGGWTVTGNQAVNAANIDFPTCTSGTATITYAAIGLASSGAGQIAAPAAVSLSVATNTLPQIAAGQATFTMD